VRQDAHARTSLRPHSSERHGRRLGARPATLTAASLAALTLVAAGCGGSTTTTPPIAAIGTTKTATTPSPPPSNDPIAQAVRYAACMRSHGLPSFRDPKQISQGGHQTIRIQTPDLNSPQAQTAEKACTRFLPSGFNSSPAQNAQQRAHLLAFARCMRSHGIPNFPDPTSSGSFPTSITRIDRSAPIVRSAANTCLPDAAGAISFGTGHSSTH
jgi:hypothetical protein